MRFFLDIPLEARLLALFSLGVLVGNLINFAVYAWAYTPRCESPWLRAHPRDARDGWLDRLPLVGWYRLRRKSAQLGSGFWVRPMVVELLTGLLFAWLYDWEIDQLALVQPFLQGPNGQPLPLKLDVSIWLALHICYAGHLFLFSMLLIGTFIDFDEQTIPDAVTTTATLAGLLFAACFPSSLMPAVIRVNAAKVQWIEIVTLAFRAADLANWPAMLGGAPEWRSLAIALGCFWLWCAALLPWIWLPRRGLSKAVRMLIAAACRSSNFLIMAIIFVAGTAGIVTVWLLSGTRQVSELHWIGLLTSLVGMAGGAGMIWGVRIMGSLALKREAMGFGDVTLMAAIGSFLGWQACVLIFFIAPCLGLAYGIVRLILGLGRELPYGPFLCLAALVVVIAWRPLWDSPTLAIMFGVPWLMPAAMVVCLVLVGVLLSLLRIILPR